MATLKQLQTQITVLQSKSFDLWDNAETSGLSYSELESIELGIQNEIDFINLQISESDYELEAWEQAGYESQEHYEYQLGVDAFESNFPAVADALKTPYEFCTQDTLDTISQGYKLVREFADTEAGGYIYGTGILDELVEYRIYYREWLESNPQPTTVDTVATIDVPALPATSSSISDEPTDFTQTSLDTDGTECQNGINSTNTTQQSIEVSTMTLTIDQQIALAAEALSSSYQTKVDWNGSDFILTSSSGNKFALGFYISDNTIKFGMEAEKRDIITVRDAIANAQDTTTTTTATTTTESIMTNIRTVNTDILSTLAYRDIQSIARQAKSTGFYVGKLNAKKDTLIDFLVLAIEAGFDSELLPREVTIGAAYQQHIDTVADEPIACPPPSNETLDSLLASDDTSNQPFNLPNEVVTSYALEQLHIDSEINALDNQLSELIDSSADELVTVSTNVEPQPTTPAVNAKSAALPALLLFLPIYLAAITLAVILTPIVKALTDYGYYLFNHSSIVRAGKRSTGKRLADIKRLYDDVVFAI